MIKIKDKYGVEQECLYLLEHPSYQPKTGDVFWNVTAIGYDGIRRNTLFLFNSENEMHEKYLELRQQYLEKYKKEISEKK